MLYERYPEAQLANGGFNERAPIGETNPAFGRLEELTGRAFKVIYDDANPNRLVREEQVDPSELTGMPRDGLSGAGAVERILDGLLP